MADGQIDPLDESGVESSREAQSLQGGFESVLGSKTHHLRDPYQLAPAVAFFHLTVDKARLHMPPAHVPPSPTYLEPQSKMSRQRIEVQI
jgi:hypothetical protein